MIHGALIISNFFSFFILFALAINIAKTCTVVHYIEWRHENKFCSYTLAPGMDYEVPWLCDQQRTQKSHHGVDIVMDFLANF